ncbi:hypothetical protein HK104_003907 [Borealophlyctis nickersoniae]|nr:hypothetical protein HK104_003907 [Borealophlyctis nickersoniae]
MSKPKPILKPTNSPGPTPSSTLKPKPAAKSKSVPSTPKPTASSPAGQPRSTSSKSKKRGFDLTVHDLNRLKLSPLQMRLRKANAEKYTDAHRVLLRRQDGDGDGDGDGEEWDYDEDENNDGGGDDKEDLAEGSPTRNEPSGDSPRQRRVERKHTSWGVKTEVDFDREVNLWRRVGGREVDGRGGGGGRKRVVKRVQSGGNLRTPSPPPQPHHPSKPIPPSRYPIRTTHLPDQQQQQQQQQQRSSSPIPSEPLKHIATGLVHLHNTLTSRISGIPMGGGLDASDVEDVESESSDACGNEKNQGSHALMEFSLRVLESVLSSTTKFVTQTTSRAEAQERRIETLETEVGDARGAISRLEEAQKATHAHIQELTTALSQLAAAHESEIEGLKQRQEGMQVLEDAKDVERAVRLAMMGMSEGEGGRLGAWKR